MNTSFSLLRVCVLKLAVVATFCASPVLHAASPFLDAGDAALRHDVQLLADWGVIRSPVTTWPLPAAAIAADMLDNDRLARLSATQLVVAERLRRRLREAMQQVDIKSSARFALATDEKSFRVFEDTPRDSGGVQLQAEGLGMSWAYRARFSYAIDPDDNKNYRGDGSYAALNLGNWALGVGAQDRWWGPGWEGSLIYSNNARPITSLFLQRNQSTPFESNWLSWLGHWNLVTTIGQLESGRFVPRALFFSMRVSFRPLQGLEIGLSRTAQFGGKGRTVNFKTFGKLLIGQDNEEIAAGANRVDSDEPGNQLAGYDVRYSFAGHGLPLALYTQLIGEDEAGYLPSRLIGQFGIEGWLTGARGTWRWNVEYSDTVVDFLGNSKKFGSAYNGGLYQSGYRYYDESIGHAIDGSARATSVGLRYVKDSGNSAQLVVTGGELGRTANGAAVDFVDAKILASAKFSAVDTVNIGIGVSRREQNSESEAENDIVGHISWGRDF